MAPINILECFFPLYLKEATYNDHYTLIIFGGMQERNPFLLYCPQPFIQMYNM